MLLALVKDTEFTEVLIEDSKLIESETLRVEWPAELLYGLIIFLKVLLHHTNLYHFDI